MVRVLILVPVAVVVLVEILSDEPDVGLTAFREFFDHFYLQSSSRQFFLSSNYIGIFELGLPLMSKAAWRLSPSAGH